MRFLGAKVVLTPAAERGIGMVDKADELAETHGWFLTRQFENEANADMHSRTTAREILDDFEGERLDYWVTGFGTGGTLKGVARVLAKERPDTKIVVCEPADAPMLGSGDRAGAQRRTARRRQRIRRSSRIRCRAGAPDFIPKLTGDAVDTRRDRPDPADRRRRRDALQPASSRRRKASSSASPPARRFAGALQVCAEAPKGSNILCMLPDTGERYLSTPLFADIPADMTEEELQISKSTPTAQMPPPA